MNRKTLVLALTLVVVLGLDVTTKRWALSFLEMGQSIHLFEGLLPLTLAFNQGAAFSIHVGPASRWVFLALSIAALTVLVVLYRRAQPHDLLRLQAVSLVAAGAMGNLIDRVRWGHGVVDFIGPIDLGFMHWPIFNVADMAITCGAVLLVLSLWQEERQLEALKARQRDEPAGRPPADPPHGFGPAAERAGGSD